MYQDSPIFPSNQDRNHAEYIKTGFKLAGKIFAFYIIAPPFAFLLYYVFFETHDGHQIVEHGLLCISLVVFTFLFSKENKKTCSIGILPSIPVFGWFCFGLIVGTALQGLNFWYRIIFSGLIFDWNPDWQWDSWVQGFGLTFVKAAEEELVYRGYVFLLLISKIGVLRTLFLTSFLFALPHLDNENIPNLDVITTLLFYLFSGMFYGLVFLATKTLWFPIAVHTSSNFAIYSIYGMKHTEWFKSIFHIQYENDKIAHQMIQAEWLLHCVLLSLVSYLLIRSNKALYRTLSRYFRTL